MTFGEVARLCRVHYSTVWRLARKRQQLTHYRRSGLWEIDDHEIYLLLDRKLKLRPGTSHPESLLCARWLSIKEAAIRLGLPYHRVYRSLGRFTRTRFFGKTMILAENLEGVANSEETASRADEQNTAVVTSLGLGVNG